MFSSKFFHEHRIKLCRIISTKVKVDVRLSPAELNLSKVQLPGVDVEGWKSHVFKRKVKDDTINSKQLSQGYQLILSNVENISVQICKLIKEEIFEIYGNL